MGPHTEESILSALAFLAEPWFVIPWYAAGALGALWVWRDLHHANTVLKKAIGWGWPIIVLFFSVPGLALYLATARAPGVARAEEQHEKKRLHDRYQQAMWRRVNGAVIHCVAGDGLGIMTGMVIARLLEMSFWQEFWFEYAVGFAFGWFIFQYQSMKMMTDSQARALAMAFRAEFFSMLTVMGGMGAVMAYVTPVVVGIQPKPWTAAFWGFGMLGLLAGYVLTFPMNWMMVKLGWKHGMGRPEGSHPVQRSGARMALLGAMCILGVAATMLPGWVAVVRERHELAVARDAAAQFASGASLTRAGGPVQRGLGASLEAARQALAGGERAVATAALDDATRAAEVVQVADLAPGPRAHLAVRAARRALQNGREDAAAALLAQADALPAAGPRRAGHPSPPADYGGAMLLDATGAMVGKVLRVQGGRALVAIGGVHDFLGLWDLGGGRQGWLPLDELVLGPAHAVGRTYAMLPTLRAAWQPLTDASPGPAQARSGS